MALTHPVTPFPAYLGTTAAAIFTSTTTKRFIKGVWLFNGNTTAETVKIYIVPNSGGSLGTAGITNQMAEIAVAAKATVFFPLNMDGQPLVMNVANDSVQASTTTASKVNFIVSYESE